MGDRDGGSTEAPVKRSGVMTSPTFLLIEKSNVCRSGFISVPSSYANAILSPATFTYSTIWYMAWPAYRPNGGVEESD